MQLLLQKLHWEQDELSRHLERRHPGKLLQKPSTGLVKSKSSIAVLTKILRQTSLKEQRPISLKRKQELDKFYLKLG